ncbi:MAG: hypothetical protein LBV23_00095 [Deltaproteobacteria bacterium]|jgi:hypothetical protein|nr:hypothetical protein [Deltaproteobacteria bacterium]
MLKLNYNSKVAANRNVGKKDLVNGYKYSKGARKCLGLEKPPAKKEKRIREKLATFFDRLRDRLDDVLGLITKEIYPFTNHLKEHHQGSF